MKATKYVLMLAWVAAIACSEVKPADKEVEVKTDPALCFDMSNSAGSSPSFEGVFTIEKTQNAGNLPPVDCGDDFELVSFSGSGISSDLGASKIVLSHCVDMWSLSDDGKSYNIAMGWLEVTNSQGVGFRATYSGEHRLAERDTVRGEFFITNGSGQFEDRADGGCFRAIGTRSPDEFTLQLRAEK